MIAVGDLLEHAALAADDDLALWAEHHVQNDDVEILRPLGSGR